MTIEPGVWPAAYDDVELAENIRRLVESDRLWSEFWLAPAIHSDVCQGDVFELGARRPFLTADAMPAADSESCQFWMVIGNTCDLDRDASEVPWTAVAPVRTLGRWDALEEGERNALVKYQYGRQFFVPAWPGRSPDEGLIVNLLEIVTIDRQVFAGLSPVARMEFPGWVLFHSCVVRYHARADRRHL